MRLEDAFFYHIYPLGALGAPKANDGQSAPQSRIRKMTDWIPAMERVASNVLLLGPVFESERHGYDTVDYLTVDRRLGTNADLAAVAQELDRHGIALVLDAVFNHVGRTHPFVRDVAEKGSSSPYAHWIAGYDPSRSGQGGLPFGYENWAGHDGLVRLDTSKNEVREYLIGVALAWIEEFGIAGLRLDAADRLDPGFTAELGRRCRERKSDFFLVGEVVQGDAYPRALGEGGLDSVTDYEAYKGLWSSYNDRNYHEIAWTLDRLFGERGLCKGKTLYSFADNHDVDRVASSLRDHAGLYPLYGLLFAMPGVPSVYYGSEFGIEGKRTDHSDAALRPELDPLLLPRTSPHPDLAASIRRFAEARRASRAVRLGSYKQVHVEAEGLVFLRSLSGAGHAAQSSEDLALIAVNGSATARAFHIHAAETAGRELIDLLDPSFRLRVDGGGRATIQVPPSWLRWLAPTV